MSVRRKLRVNIGFRGGNMVDFVGLSRLVSSEGGSE